MELTVSFPVNATDCRYASTVFVDGEEAGFFSLVYNAVRSDSETFFVDIICSHTAN